MWDPLEAPVSLGGGDVTLVEGSSFCVCARSGDMRPDRPHGLLVRDTRFVSGWTLTVDDESPEPLGFLQHEPFGGTFVGRARPRGGLADSTLLVLRRRYVGDGMREDVVLRNLSGEAAAATVEVSVDADFADLFEVKEGRIRRRGELARRSGDGELVFDFHFRGATRATHVAAAGARARPGTLSWTVVVPARGEWSTCVQVRPVLDGEEVPLRYPCGASVEHSAPAQRLESWRRESPAVATPYEPLQASLERSEEDLGALRIFDPDHPERAVVAAGAPWFMTVFGRDSLLSSWMTLLLDPSLAAGTLQTLARFQGARADRLTEEEPGRILHEMRFGIAANLSLGGGNVYYGSVDSTPLFVMLLGELRRWGLGREVVDQLLPHADRAIAWIEQHGDRDGDGFVEYERATDRGLRNQGWKDSWDGVNFASGRIAEPPIALCEVQGYVYAAYLARAYFAQEAGDEETAARLHERAAALKAAFNERFWLPDRGWFALALDGDKRPVDSLTSNIGHCLWTGIVDEDKAPQVAEHLLSPRMWSGWGVRTLASDMGAYNPMSYHNGSVWPHDSALVAAGLMRYGFVEHAQRIALGLLEASAHFDGRLPELFCGFDRSEFAVPIPYPTSCSPQAWAAAAPFLLLRTLLRLDPWVPHGRVWLAPALPSPVEALRVQGVPLAGARLDVEVDDGRWQLSGLPDGVALVREPRHPSTAALD